MKPEEGKNRLIYSKTIYSSFYFSFCIMSMRSYDTAAVFRKSILTKDNPESMYVCVMVTLAALAKANPPNATPLFSIIH